MKKKIRIYVVEKDYRKVLEKLQCAFVPPYRVGIDYVSDNGQGEFRVCLLESKIVRRENK